MPRTLKNLFASVFLALYGCSLFPSPEQDSSVDVNHIGFKVHIDGWREGLIVQDIQLQDASGSMVELETMFLTIINMEGSRLVVNMISCLLPPGRFIGHIILRV